MPGMAANSKIFERIQLPSEVFDMHFLEWIPPQKNESLTSYASRISESITHRDSVLIGVSFGGIIVQELKPFVNPRKIIIISSVKSNSELSKQMRIARRTKAYKLLPTKLFVDFKFFSKYVLTLFNIKERITLYKKYLTVRDKNYLDWSIEHIVNWEREEIDEDVVHIHGELDEVFPIKNIKNCIRIPGGTHIMILTKFKWLNENLPKIILK